MATYKLLEDSTIVRDDGVSIPQDPKNPDFREYLAFLAGGGTATPAPPRVPPDLVDDLSIVTLKIAFNHENRIRALEGKQAITLAQFKTAVKALLAS